MLVQLLIGISMTAMTIIVGSLIIVISTEQIQKYRDWLNRGQLLFRHVVALTLITTWLVVGLLIVMGLWALVLLALGVFSELEPALYFSMISFTTLGFGDVILPDQWRLLSGFIAMDGFILFGLNTAFLFEVLRRLREESKLTDKADA